MEPNGLDTTHPDQLTYRNKILTITVLGGIKPDGLDRMRATLKITLENSSLPAIRHNLDLYNDSQCEKLIRKAAERLETGTSLIMASLHELIEHLETYRMEELKKQTADTPIKAKQLNKKEKQAATEFLQSGNLLKRTNELIGQSGVIGEEQNRLLMYLIFTSRKRTHPLHVVSLGASGTGKTHLQEKVGELIPEEDRLSLTCLSENSFYYFGRQELKNKLILIEDLDGAENVLYPLRELQSKKSISKTIAHKNTKGETKTMHLVVEGPVSVAGCTTKEKIYEDNANRSFLIYPDDSPAQTGLILDYQRKLSAGKINTEEENQAAALLRNCQRLLKPIKVINPYAEQLKIPQEVFKPRRTNTHYLQFIECVTFYHQYQRAIKQDSQSGTDYIETTLEDIETANQLLKPILLRKSDELTGACRNHFEQLKLYLIGRQQHPGTQPARFTNQQISKLFRIPLTTVKRHHLELMNNGYLKTTKEKGSKAYVYEVVSYEEYNELQNKISTVLDQSLEQLKQTAVNARQYTTNANKKNLTEKEKPKSPQQPNKENGPVNHPQTKDLKPMDQSS